MINSVGDIVLNNVTPQGEVPKERLKNAQSVRDIFQVMVTADRVSSGKRAEVQAMRDGKPPYDQNVLAATGQGSRTNLNFGDAEVILESGESSMLDIIESTETLVSVPLKHGVIQDAEQKRIFEEMLADEITRTFREWDLFVPNYQMIVQKWLAHGVGIAYWENATDWRFEATGFDDMKIPRDTRASETRLETAGCRREYKLHEIYEKIHDEEMATRLGWNVKAVKAAMLKAYSESTASPYTADRWEALQAQLRDDDLNTGARSQTVRVIHLWVKEFDGSASMYAVTQDKLDGEWGNEDDFLYKAKGVYPRGMTQAFVFFTYGIGTNGNYHGIAGLGRKIYPHIQVLNRTRSNFVDAANLSAGVMLQPKDASAYEQMQWTSIGPMTLLPPEDVASVVARTLPNLSQTITPVLADMQNSLDQRTGQLSIDSPYQNSVERTTSEINALVQTRSRVGSTQLSIFYGHLKRLFREMVRRLCAEDYTASPGSESAVAMRKRLAEKGFPPELFPMIDYDQVTCVKAVGAGSDAARVQALSQLVGMAGSYDDVGRHNVYRDLTAAALRSYEAADRYIPRLPQDTRPPMDAQIAALENNSMKFGEQCQVMVNQLHTTHLDIHLPKISEILAAVESGEIEMIQVVKPLTVMHEHCVEHLSHIEGDESIAEKVNTYRQALSNAGEIVWNANKQLMAEQRKAQEEGPQEEGGALDPEMQRDLIANQVKLDFMRQQGELKMQQRQQEFLQKQSFKDADQQQKMLNHHEMTRAQLDAQKKMTDARIAEQKRASVSKPKTT